MTEPIRVKIEVKSQAYWENPRDFAARKLGEFAMMQMIDGHVSQKSFLQDWPNMRRCGKTFWATYEALRLACDGKDVVVLTDTFDHVYLLADQIQRHVDLGLREVGVSVKGTVRPPDAVVETESLLGSKPGRIFLMPAHCFDDDFLCGRRPLNVIDDKSKFLPALPYTIRDNRHRIDSYVTALDLLKRAIKESK